MPTPEVALTASRVVVRVTLWGEIVGAVSADPARPGLLMADSSRREAGAADS